MTFRETKKKIIRIRLLAKYVYIYTITFLLLHLIFFLPQYFTKILPSRSSIYEPFSENVLIGTIIFHSALEMSCTEVWLFHLFIPHVVFGFIKNKFPLNNIESAPLSVTHSISTVNSVH